MSSERSKTVLYCAGALLTKTLFGVKMQLTNFLLTALCMGRSSDGIREAGEESLEVCGLDQICQRLSERFDVPVDSIRKTFLRRALDKNAPLFLDSKLLSGMHFRGHQKRVQDRLNSLRFWFIDGEKPILRWKSPGALSHNDTYITISEGKEAVPGQDLDALLKSGARIEMRTVRVIDFMAGDAVRERRQREVRNAAVDEERRVLAKRAMDAAARGEEDID